MRQLQFQITLGTKDILTRLGDEFTMGNLLSFRPVLRSPAFIDCESICR